jgi:hypothetical protein
VDITLAIFVAFSVSNSSNALCTFVLAIFQAGTTVTEEAGSEPPTEPRLVADCVRILATSLNAVYLTAGSYAHPPLLSL